MVLLSSLYALGAKVDDYKPKWFSESWAGNQSRPWGILNNFWVLLSPFTSDYSGNEKVDPYASADSYGWYNGTFFGLANWEREVCLIDLSSDVRNVRNAITDSDLEQTTVYTTTLTISATKEYAFNGSYLYEVSWYIMPYGDDALYRVYLANGSSKEYIKGLKGDADEKWATVTKLMGAAGYEAKYIQNNFDKAVIEYRDAGSEIVNEMSVSVVDKDKVETNG
jgi:hypothetical protein